MRDRRRTLALFCVLMVISAISTSLAYWSTSGGGAATLGIGGLNPPPKPALQLTGGGTAVKVDWSPGSTLSDNVTPAQGYYVTRSNGVTTVAACGTSPTSLTTSTSCEDGSLAAGVYTYGVVAVWRSLSAESPASEPVSTDTTPPTNSLSLTGQSGGGSFLSETTIYYRGTVAGSFAIRNAVADSGSGPASSAFPALGGTTTGWTHSGSTVTTPSGGPYVSGSFSWSAGTSSSPTETVTGADNAGNTTPTTVNMKSDTTAPTGSISYTNGYNVTGTVAVTFSASDEGSGVNSASGQLKRAAATLSAGVCGTFSGFENLGSAGVASPYNDSSVATNACYRYEYVVSDNVGNQGAIGSANVVKVDTTAPSGGAVSVPAYSKATSVAVTFSAGTDAGSGINAASGQLKRATATLSNGSCGSFGEFANVGAAGPTSPFTNSGLENGRCYVYQYVVADNAGNSTTYGPSAPVQVDTTPPTNSLSLTGQSGGGSFLSGTTIYYRGTVAGSFAIRNAVADSGSGPASSAFPALGGTTTGWTHSGSTVTTPSGGPYVSGSFSWTAGTSSSPTEVVTGADKAGNQSPTTLTFANDTTAPSGGSITYANGFNITGAVEITYSAGSDAGSGINTASGQLKRAKATLSGGSCGTFGSFENVGAAGVSSPYKDSSVATNSCYKYEYVVSDNVGNQAAYISTNIVEVDTTLPSNSLSLASQTGGGSFLAGTTIFYRGTVAGSFKIVNTISDAGSGPASSAFPKLGGTTTGWTHTGSTVSGTGPAYTSNAFEWAGSTSSSPAEVVTGADKAGNQSPTTLTFANDTTAPSGGSVSVPAFSKGTTVAVTFSAGSDAGSGVNTAGAVLSRAEGTYTPATDTCGALGSFKSIGTGPTSPFSNTVANNQCYRYQYAVADNVGNAVTYESGTLKVNTTGPTVSAVSSLDPAGAAAKGKLVNGATLTITFSEPVEPASIAAGCPASCTITGAKETRGATGNVFLVVPGITTSGGADTGSTAYLAGSGTATATFTAAVAFSGGNSVLTITVSEVAGTPAESSGELRFTPATTLTDLFGNAATGTFKTASTFKLF